MQSGDFFSLTKKKKIAWLQVRGPEKGPQQFADVTKQGYVLIRQLILPCSGNVSS